MKNLSLTLFQVLIAFFVLNFAPHVMAQETDDDVFMLEEVTVTAEKRAVNVQDTAMSITAITGSEIEDKAINDLKGALDGLAGVNVLGIPGGGNIFIRGVGSTIASSLGESSVSVQVDNVYVGRSEVTLSSMYDVERVEVLRGPQGTMYGRNAAGGQINVLSKNPTDQFEAEANLTIGDYNLKKYGTMVNIPIVSKWAARVALNREARDGYISDGSDSADRLAGRVKLSFKPTNSLSFLLTAEHTYDKSSPANTVPVSGSAGNLVNLGFVVPDVDCDGVADDFIDADGEENPNGIPDLIDTGWDGGAGADAWSQDPYHPQPWSDNTFEYYQLEINWDMEWGQLFVLPAINHNERSLWSELLFGTSQGSDISEQSYEEDQWSTEIRLQSPNDSKIQWMTGFYFLESENKDISEVAEDPLETSEEEGGGWVTETYRRPNDVKAFFGQMTYPLTDRFRITAGLRYNEENREMAYRFANADITDPEDAYYDLAVNGVYDSGLIEDNNKQDNVSYKGGIEFDLNNESMLYASVTTGFKAGGLNILGVVPITEYDPEELIAYTIGSKNRFLNNRLQVNMEAYYYDYDGYQAQVMTQMTNAVTGDLQQTNIVVNADKGYNMGLEIESEYLITQNDRVSMSMAYMDTEYGKLVLGSNPVAGYMQEFDLTGRDMANAPKLSGTLSYEHNWVLENGAQLTGSLSTKISDGYYTTHEQYLPGAWQDSYHMSNLYLTYYSPDGKYSVGIWCKNLENEDATVRCMPAYRRIIMAPRTTGVTFSVKL